jgi:hypothetical protein
VGNECVDQWTGGCKDLTQTFDFDFPAEALKAKKLKEIRLELSYVPSPDSQETAKLVVSIGG